MDEEKVNDCHGASMELFYEWQMSKQKIAQRSQLLLETGIWCDCEFLVGQESNQQLFKGHKIFLAMTSPVFGEMLYRNASDKNEPIQITDVDPKVFKALLEYVYTDRVNLVSSELACELCYCAKKYMLPFLVDECIRYMWSDLSPKIACRAYELSKTLENSIEKLMLMRKALLVIRSNTNEVISASSWENLELETLTTILEQDELSISSEVDLFNALERWAKAECTRQSLDPSNPKYLKYVTGNALTYIRFLTITPQEFVLGPGKSSILTQEEKFAILMNVASPNSEKEMPEGFCTSTQSRTDLMISNKPCFNNDVSENSNTSSSFICNSVELENSNTIKESSSSTQERSAILNQQIRDSPKYCCKRSVKHQDVNIYNDNILECAVTFVADKNICVLGLQVPSQILNRSQGFQPAKTSYTEILYAYLLDSYGTRLTYTHFSTKVFIQDLIEVIFNRPIYVKKHAQYKIGVVFNKEGWYPLASCSENEFCDNILFCFGVGSAEDTIRDGLIRSIIFTYH